MYYPRNKYRQKSIVITLIIMISALWFIYNHYYDHSKKPGTFQHEVESGALAAIKFWTEQRTYPNNFIDEKKFSEAFQEKYAIQIKSANKSLTQWEAIGPANRGGRMLALAFNPLNTNTIYAGSASGGLWRSYSSGEGYHNWHQVHTGHPILGVGAIAFLPGDSSTIFIGTGEVYRYEDVNGGLDVRTYRGSYGNGILRSTDGGITWDKVLDWDYNEKHGVQVIRVNPLRPETIWAGTSHGIYRSADGGSNWQLIDEVIMVTDIEINPVDTSQMYMACGNFGSQGHGIYRSQDGGSTWSKMKSGLPQYYGGKALLSMSPTYPEIIYAGIGNGYSSSAGTWLCKTIDGGDNWIIINDTNYSSYQGWFAHDVAVHPLSPDTVLCFGVRGWRSVDGGESLLQITSMGPGTDIHVDFHALVFKPGSPNTFYIASDGGIYRSDDIGESFTRLDDGLQTTQFYNGFSNSHQNAYKALGGLQDNGTYRYKGLDNWIFEFGGDGSWTAIDPGNDNIMYVSYQNLNIQKSIDGGANFYNIAPPYIGSVCFIAPFVLAPTNPDILYAGRSYVLRSGDGGNSWNTTNGSSELDGNPVLSMAISHQDPDVVYVATAPRNGSMNAFATQNGGLTWSNIKANLPERYPIDLAVNPTNDAEVYIVLSGFGSAHLYKSVNHGNTWINISSQLPDVPSSAVIIDPLNPNHVFFGNDLGVYFSNNGGVAWQLFSDGLPDAVIVKDLKISTVNRKLRLATHGNGAYEIDLPIASRVNDYEKSSNIFLVYPNPFDRFLNVKYFSNSNQPAVITIRSIDGKVVYSKERSIFQGVNEFVINNFNFPPGVYVIEMMQGGQSFTSKLLKVD